MRWASTIGQGADAQAAFGDAADRIEAALGATPDLVAMFVSRDLAAESAVLTRLACARFADSLVLGCSASGVIGDGRELEQAPALSLTAAVMPDVKLRPLRFEGLPPRPQDWPERLGIAPDVGPAFVLLADPFSLDADAFVRGLDIAYPGAVKIGGLASGADAPGGNALFLGDEVFDSGAVGAALWGDVAVDTLVAQGCRPIGEPFIVTRSEGSVIHELDRGRPLEVLQRLYLTLDEADQALARQSLFLGIEMRDQRRAYEPGDFLIRNVVGSRPETGAIAVGGRLESYQVVQFHLRDARTAAADLDARLDRYGREASSPPLEGGLLFSCLGRGRRLYGEDDHDSRALRRRLGEVPLGGFFCNGEIGPVGGRTFLHGYTSAFGLFRARGATRTEH